MRACPSSTRGDVHFLTGRARAEALGYDPALLDRIPAEAVGLREGEVVVDLGSGSGTDLFCAALQGGAHRTGDRDRHDAWRSSRRRPGCARRTAWVPA